MQIKNLFTVPAGEKVTEKALHRVLVSSICSILLCMTCLVSTTWAWFAVSVENKGNIIEIATVSIEVKQGENSVVPAEGKYTLDAQTEYTIVLHVVTSAQTDLQKAPPVYVLMIFQEDSREPVYFTFDRTEPLTKTLIVSQTCTVSLSVSWVEPAGAAAYVNEDVVTGESELVTEPATETATEETTTATTEETAAQTDPTTETTEPITEATTQPTTVPTAEPTTESTTEPSTEPITEPSIEPSAPAPSAEETTTPEETNG